MNNILFRYVKYCIIIFLLIFLSCIKNNTISQNGIMDLDVNKKGTIKIIDNKNNQYLGYYNLNNENEDPPNNLWIMGIYVYEKYIISQLCYGYHPVGIKVYNNVKNINYNDLKEKYELYNTYEHYLMGIYDDYLFLLSMGYSPTIREFKIIDLKTKGTFDDKFMHLLNKNFSTGNIIAIIIGDDIHPNLLGLIESIQSAPHLAFNISLVKIEAYENDNRLIISPKIVEKTNEIERSVIKITFDNNLNKPIIESETPTKDGKGTRPKLSWEDYINSVEEKYKKTIEKYKQEWIKSFGNTINMGTVGFTAGVIIGEKRLAPLWVYDNKIELITERGRSKMGISDKTYLVYKKELEKTPEIYDKYLVSGKQMVNFNDISIEALENIFNATIKYGIEIQNDYKK